MGLTRLNSGIRPVCIFLLGLHQFTERFQPGGVGASGLKRFKRRLDLWAGGARRWSRVTAQLPQHEHADAKSFVVRCYVGVLRGA
jgi:hypothetical protein